MKTRKVGIIGTGHVGAHVASALLLQGIADKIVLVDTNEARVRSERQDLFDTFMHLPHRAYVEIGTYDDLGDCDVIVNSAGDISILQGEDRSLELKCTVPAVHTWTDAVTRSGFDGVILSISNPCDVVTREIAINMDLPKGRVLGTGTGLDTARLVSQISQATDLDPRSIQAFMLGEHGVSQFAAWSCARFNGFSYDDMVKNDPDFAFDRDEVESKGCHAGMVTFSWKHATEFSIGATAARMVKAILHDEKIIMPASAELNGEYGQSDVFAGVPCIIGKNGAEKVLELPLTDEELDKFAAACDSIRRNIETAKALSGNR